MRWTGLLRLREEILMQRSAGKMLETWRWMENRQVCVWIDNCYITMERIPRFKINRKIAQRFASLRFRAHCRISDDPQQEMCSWAASAMLLQRLSE